MTRLAIIASSLLILANAAHAGDITCTTQGDLVACTHANSAPVNYFKADPRTPQCIAGKRSAFGLPACAGALAH